jgi:hypothetical protein
VGPRRPAPRPRARRGASVLRHHHHRTRHHRRHHHCQSRRHHLHLGVISPRGTSSNNHSSSSNNNNSGRPASMVAGRSRAPSKCSPFFPRVQLSCRRVLTHPCLPGLPPSLLPRSYLLRRIPCPPAGLAPSSRHLLGVVPANRRRLPQPQRQRRRRVHRRQQWRRSQLRPPPPWGVTRGGARLALSRRPLRRRQRWFLGGGSDPAPSQKRRRFPSPGCCLVPIRLFKRSRQRSGGNGRRWNLSTSASATGAPSWRSAPRQRPTSLPLSSPN